MNNELIGVWELEPDDVTSLNLYGKMILQFKKNGDLIYNIYEGDKIQKVLLTYDTKDNIIITDQPSSPKKEKTEYQFLSKTRLKLYMNGVESTFKKIG